MTYAQAIHYLYTRTPLFQNVGQGAYKEGLSNTHALDEHFGHPHRQYRTIHVAGTNGKGSCSHTLAAILQSAGYKVGLYTSPHLTDFRERIRVNGKMIPKKRVIDFVCEEKSFFEPLYPSFFEVVTALAFQYFAEKKVDVAVIEVGLGGRLDCTNIIQPEVSVITNISFDHVQLLGDTLEKIAREKAGIIKSGIPTVIGETTQETRPVFQQKADEVGAPVFFAEDTPEIKSWKLSAEGGISYDTVSFGSLHGELGGAYQVKNTNTVLHAVEHLREAGFEISQANVEAGFARVSELTGLQGRWQKISDCPRVYCDTGHNIGGFQYITRQLAAQSCRQLRIVIGMVNDKDISGVLALLPKQAVYYFCQASVHRSLPADEVKRLAQQVGLDGHSFSSVQEAYQAALSDSSADDFLFVGGSTYVVADFFTWLQKKHEESAENNKKTPISKDF